MAHGGHLAKSYTTPWTVRAYDALSGNPISIGGGIALGLLVAFFVGLVVAGNSGSSTPDELRVAATQILITAYCATAYAYLLKTAHRTTRDLSPRPI